MVGRLGTEQMSGVSIVNQLMFVYNICIFGGVSGAGIFTAQYYGQKDDEGIRHTFRFKIWMTLILTVTAIVLFVFYDDVLINLYLRGNSDGGDLLAALEYGKQYLRIMVFSLPAFMVLQIYASTLRECGETVVPMKAGMVAVFINLVFNYLLIYGKFGFPELGVMGAAIATTMSRYIETAIVVLWTHKHGEIHTFVKGLYNTLTLPVNVAKKIFVKGMPLIVNEALWSAGMAMLTQCYSVRGLNVVAGLNIANTVNNLFNVVFLALGNSVAIVVGQLLGAGKMEEARDKDNKMIAFSVLACSGVAVIMLFMSPVFPLLYNTSEAVRHQATLFMIAQAIFMPQGAFIHAAYFTLRSGGKTVVTFFFDCVFMWVVSVPVVFILSRFTEIPAHYIFVCCQVADWIKCVIGFILVKNGVWIQNIVKQK
jgi:putative MATE family efflux protein